jgi:hypothetical protein
LWKLGTRTFHPTVLPHTRQETFCVHQLFHNLCLQYVHNLCLLSDCLFVFTSQSRIFHLHGDVTTACEGLQKLAYARRSGPCLQSLFTISVHNVWLLSLLSLLTISVHNLCLRLLFTISVYNIYSRILFIVSVHDLYSQSVFTIFVPVCKYKENTKVITTYLHTKKHGAQHKPA